MPASHKTPTVLIVLDGWGYREETQDNAIAKASTPVWDRLWADAPHALISASGEDVGLPSGQMGNSEVGHMSLGSGRVIYQNISRIDEAIKDGSFNHNTAFTSAIDKASAAGGASVVAGFARHACRLAVGHHGDAGNAGRHKLRSASKNDVACALGHTPSVAHEACFVPRFCGGSKVR